MKANDVLYDYIRNAFISWDLQNPYSRYTSADMCAFCVKYTGIVNISFGV